MIWGRVECVEDFNQGNLEQVGGLNPRLSSERSFICDKR